MDLVHLVRARDQIEADLIQNLLEAEGIPSIVHGAVPAPASVFGAAGARDVLVPRSALEAARAVLEER